MVEIAREIAPVNANNSPFPIMGIVVWIMSLLLGCKIMVRETPMRDIIEPMMVKRPTLFFRKIIAKNSANGGSILPIKITLFTVVSSRAINVMAGARAPERVDIRMI